MKEKKSLPLISKSLTLILMMVFLSSGSLLYLTAQERSLDREKISGEYKWNLSHIYPNWEAWEKDIENLKEKMKMIEGLKGTLGKSPEHLLKVLTLEDELGMLAFKVYKYPQLMRDLNTKDQKVSANFQKIKSQYSKYQVVTAWIIPEILKIPWEKTKKWIDSNPDFAPYRFTLESLYRQQAHVLDEEKETLLAYSSPFRSSPYNIYSELSTSDIVFPEVKFSNGEKMTMTSGNYGKILATNYNQEDRKKAFEAHYSAYKKNINTYAAIYHAICQRDWAQAQARKYSSTLEAELDDSNIPVAVYENLIKTVKANVEPLRKYVRLRAKVLKLDQYHLYDTAINLTDFNKTYPYDLAKKWVLESVAPLGKEYQQKVQKAISSGWIDVYENTGKASGAYSSNVYGVHPYILLNYNETLGYVFTLAHELGHAMHTLLSNENQPFATHSYTIFVAEVASTFNERLLLDYLLEKTKDPKERIALLERLIKGLANTFYFQVLLADLELQVHRMVEQGKPITAQILNDTTLKIFKDYFGDTMTIPQLQNIFWSRVTHFFVAPYYVYQYATCFASSAQLYDSVTKGPKKLRKANLKKYFDLLKSGGNDYPMNQLKKAGIDLSKPEPILAVIKQMDHMVNLLEEEINKIQ